MILFSFLNRNLVYLPAFKMAPPLRCLLIISFISVATTSGAPHHSNEDYEENECDGDHNKCGGGFFCYTDTNKCAPCITCGSYYRNNNTFQCHHKASDCGDCLPGYQERSLERNIEKESCEPVTEGVITTSKNSALPAATEEMLNLLWFFGGIGGLSLFIIASFLLAHWHKGRRSAEPQMEAPQELQELVTRPDQPPPPYSPFGEKLPTSVVNAEPTAPSMDSTLQVDSPRDCDARIYVETHPRQIPPPPPLEQANLVCQPPELFALPNWVNGMHCTGLRRSTPPSSGDNSINGPDLDDENTQPSDWTPNTSQENVEEAGNHLMSFNTAPPPLIGSTNVGTVDPPIHQGTNLNQAVTRVRSRESEGDNEGLASSQESCEDDTPRMSEKRMRSESPPNPQQTRNFHPNVFLSQNNINNNNISLQPYQAIQINLNLSRGEDLRDPEASPTANALLDSEDFMA